MGGASRLLMLITTPSTLVYPRSAALRLARHHSRLSRRPVSTAAAAAHAHLPSRSPNPRPRFSVRAAEQVHTQAVIREDIGSYTGHPPRPGFSHPWPEWSKLVNHVTAGGYHAGDGVDDSFVELTHLPVEFVKDAKACLSFALERPDLVRLLSRRDIEVVVKNGLPFLFKNGDDSTRRMRSLIGGENQVLESERAHTVDIMRYLLSYASNPLVTSDNNNISATEHTEASVRNLLNELVNMSGIVRESNYTELAPRPPSFGQEQFSRPPGKNIEMKRGDWICSKCSFMNFARNIRCLECNEGRPKQQLTGGEWECPQCDFFNYGRNTACLRCDCNRPGGSPTSPDMPGSKNTHFEQILNGVTTDKSEIERRLAANDEKAERWFSKAAQLDDASDLSRAAADEDFPEIMPMRKGENRFVVSTRKTPLERRLANAQNNLGNGSVADQSNSQFGRVSRSDRTTDSVISKSLDRILGRPSSTSETNQQSAGSNINSGTGSELNSPDYSRSVASQRRDPGYVPFVPLPADMFSKTKVDNDMQQVVPREESPAKASQQNDSVYKFSESPSERKTDTDSSDASERWFTKVAELGDVTDLANAIPNEDFPEIMPMRKGENRFVVSKKKDRSLTSPQYKRRLAMEQANNSNFVPFVPFPPDYFAKKDTKPGSTPTTAGSSTGSATPLEQVQGVTEKLVESKPPGASAVNVGNMPQQPGNWKNSGNNKELYQQNTSASNMASAYGGHATNSSQASSNNTWNNSHDAWNGGTSQRNNASNGSYGIGGPPNSGQSANNTWNRSGDAWNSGNSQRNTASIGSNPPPPPPPTENLQSSWKFSGKSLEGSAVKESDPLDMSEEAKAERWFRRVAQIKDISELSQIPDEDFPEIMPMRKGVNRFVVSKRKTPLERRLTSPQYRRNLPIVSSESEKDSRKE